METMGKAGREGIKFGNKNVKVEEGRIRHAHCEGAGGELLFSIIFYYSSHNAQSTEYVLYSDMFHTWRSQAHTSLIFGQQLTTYLVFALTRYFTCPKSGTPLRTIHSPYQQQKLHDIVFRAEL